MTLNLLRPRYPDGTSDSDSLSDADDNFPVYCLRCGWQGRLKQLNIIAIHKTLCPICNSENIEYKE